MRTNTSEFNRILGFVYSSALDDGNWQKVTESVSSTFGGSAGLFMIRGSPVEPPRTYASTGIDPAIWNDYQSHFYQVDDWGASLSRQPAESVCTSDEMIARRRLLKSEWYNDFLKPAGIQDVLVLRTSPADSFTTLSIYRDRKAREFGSEERNFMRFLAPHCRRAIDIQFRLNAKLAKIIAGDELLNSIQVAVVLLDRRGRVIRMNDIARVLFSRGDGILIKGRKLTAQSAGDDSTLQGILCAACTAPIRDLMVYHGTGEIFVRRRGKKQPYSVTAMPVVPTEQGLFAPEMSAIVVIQDPDARRELPVDTLQNSYGLTLAEGQMLVSLVQGEDVRTYAEQAGVTVNTARWRLKHIFAKTGCHSQSELMRLLLAGPGMLNTTGSDSIES